MAHNVNITSNGIQKVLRNYNERQALAEYIWNGFDANAGTVKINYAANELGFVDSLEISDDGHGINFDNLSIKFAPFFESEKALQLSHHKNRSVMHGKNGVGRLTFFKFANDAEWQTTFLHHGALHSGRINIGMHALNHYQASLLDIPLKEKSGTRVIFSNMKISSEDLEQEIIPYLKAEFCWFLELNKSRGYQILVNDSALDYSDCIQDYEEDILISFDENDTVFKLKFVQWKESLHKELSKVYFINEKNEEMHKEYTTLNKKADEYFHSVYIQSEFFSDFDFSGSEFDTQAKLYQRSKTSAEFKFLLKKVNELLREKRKKFLKEYSSRLLERFEREGVISKTNGTNSSAPGREELFKLIKTIYEIQPRLFSNLSVDQKKTLITLLETLLVSDQRHQIAAVFENIVEMDAEEKTELEAILLS